MDTVAWIAQIVLAVLFIGSGVAKLTQSKEKLQGFSMAWTEDFTEPQLKLIGGAEVLGAIGLVLPWATGIAEVLTPIAAVGLAVVMLGALATHVRRKEWVALPPPVVLLAGSVFVAWARFGGIS
ncbi:MAG: DoxX family protein [Thermocrispum sp.]